MNNKGTGAVFCLISAILMAARYISAAIFMSNVSSWNRELFFLGLGYVGPALTIASVIALIIGIVFLVYGLLKD